jgi:HAD superfamily hydrolase (TIGR01509 family)
MAFFSFPKRPGSPSTTTPSTISATPRSSARRSIGSTGTGRRRIDAAYGRFFLRHLALVSTNDEALPVLEALRVRGIRTSLATNTNRPLAEELLRRAGLLDALDTLACADEVPAGKPDPAVLHLAARRLSIPLEEAFFVGDSRYDAEAAAAAPVRFAGYRFGKGPRIESLRELLDRA